LRADEQKNPKIAFIHASQVVTGTVKNQRGAEHAADPLSPVGRSVGGAFFRPFHGRNRIVKTRASHSPNTSIFGQ